ncbi:hypothetical protein SU65_08190 [Flavobacterium psychrophilum]|nr:hypothetical protein SU65_08190 [Flavobacterium psychrophilum]
MSQKYSKSGVKLPIISPVNENHCLGKYRNGNMIAGCENVNGIFLSVFFFVSSLQSPPTVLRLAEAAD